MNRVDVVDLVVDLVDVDLDVGLVDVDLDVDLVDVDLDVDLADIGLVDVDFEVDLDLDRMRQECFTLLCFGKSRFVHVFNFLHVAKLFYLIGCEPREYSRTLSFEKCFRMH